MKILLTEHPALAVPPELKFIKANKETWNQSFTLTYPIGYVKRFER